MFNKILVVCIGNICRSPVGEALLRHHLKLNAQEIQVNSAGLSALIGHGAHEFSMAVLQEQGFDISAHRAQQLTEAMAREHDLILVMEKNQQKRIENLYPLTRGKVFCLGHWRNLEIADPYGEPKTAFDKMLQDVTLCVQDWVARI